MDIDDFMEHFFKVSITCENDNRASEYRQLAYWLGQLIQLKRILGEDYDLDRLKELVQADKEGRCLILTDEQKKKKKKMAKQGMFGGKE